MRLPEITMHSGLYVGQSAQLERPVFLKHITLHQVFVALCRMYPKQHKKYKVFKVMPMAEMEEGWPLFIDLQQKKAVCLICTASEMMENFDDIVDAYDCAKLVSEAHIKRMKLVGMRNQLKINF